MSDWVYIGAAYGLTWLVLALYALYIRRRVRRSERELAAVEARSDDNRRRVTERLQKED